MTALLTSREQLAELREQRDAINEEAAKYFATDPEWREARAQEMAQAIYEGFQTENLVELLTDVERLPLNGRSKVSRVRGLQAFHTSRGGYIEESYLKSDTAEIPHDTLGFATKIHEDQLEVGFAETAATVVELGTQTMNAAVNKRVLSTFQAAVPDGHESYVEVNGGLGLTALNNAIDAVQDATLTGEVTIIGRKTMTGQIIDAITQNNSYGAYTPATNEDLLRRGVLGDYRGTRIVTLTNFRDGNEVPFFPANELWIIGRDAGKTAFYGGMKSKQELDANWFWHYRQRMDYGVIVMRPDHTRRLVDEDMAP